MKAGRYRSDTLAPVGVLPLDGSLQTTPLDQAMPRALLRRRRAWHPPPLSRHHSSAARGGTHGGTRAGQPPGGSRSGSSAKPRPASPS